MGRTKKEREELKKKIADLNTLGYGIPQIAKDLDLHERTCYRYLADYRKKIAKEQANTADEIIGQLTISQERRMRYLQGILSEGTKSEKMKALALLQQEEQLWVKRNQLMGYLPNEAPTIAIQNTNVVEGTTTIADSIRRKHPELLERFKHNKARLVDAKAKKDSKGD